MDRPVRPTADDEPAPTARRYGVEEVLAAADRYQETTGRIVNLQYCLLRGVNDSPEQARLLATLLEKRRIHVNLLVYNPTGPGLSGVAYEPSRARPSACSSTSCTPAASSPISGDRAAPRSTGPAGSSGRGRVS